VLYETEYEHPLFDAAAMRAQEQLWSSAGRAQHMVLRRALWLGLSTKMACRRASLSRNNSAAYAGHGRSRTNPAAFTCPRNAGDRGMNAIYTGHVAHNRPGKHRLRYSVFMLALDLDEYAPEGLKLPQTQSQCALRVFDRDHGARIDAPLKPQIEAKLREAGIAWDGGRIVLLTMPRLFNYVFNPLSVYFCYRKDGALAALVHEVSNTFGEWHFYVLPPHVQKTALVTQACDKQFFVSPFLEGGSALRIPHHAAGDDVSVAMIVRRGDEVALTASFAGRRRELTDAQLFCALGSAIR
jgi:DUF1365 family protein